MPAPTYRLRRHPELGAAELAAARRAAGELSGQLDLENQEAILYRPGSPADKRVVEEILLSLLDEQLARLTLQWGNPPFLYGLGARSESTEQFFNVYLGHATS